MVLNKMNIATTDLLDKLFQPRLVCKGMYAPGDLAKIETDKINEYIDRGSVIFNTAKRVDVARSSSRAGSSRRSVSADVGRVRHSSQMDPIRELDDDDEAINSVNPLMMPPKHESPQTG